MDAGETPGISKMNCAASSGALAHVIALMENRKDVGRYATLQDFFPDGELMSPQILNTVGLVVNAAGVILLFFFAFPQPTHEEGVGLALEDETSLPDGLTVGEHNKQIRAVRTKYRWRSVIGLVLVGLGLVLQIWATWASPIVQ